MTKTTATQALPSSGGFRRNDNQDMPKPQRAIALVRVSTPGQAEKGASLDAQTEEIQNYCRFKRLELARTIRDTGTSARLPLERRFCGAELLKALRNGEASHVVIAKLDRLFRNATDAAVTIEKWQSEGVTLHVLDIGGDNIDTSKGHGKFLVKLLAAVAELESDYISRRVTETKAFQKRSGLSYSAAPYGFRIVKPDPKKGGRLEEIPEEQAVLRKIRRWNGEGKSLRWIGNRLSASGVSTKKPGGTWHASTVAKILRNDVYKQRKAQA